MACWAELAKRLCTQAHIVVSWAGRSSSQAFIHNDGANVKQLHDLLGDWSACITFLPTPTVRDMIDAANTLELTIVPDGAPAHFNAALGTPVVALFENRREKYERWYPLGVPHRIVTPQSGSAVEGITTDQVCAAALALL